MTEQHHDRSAEIAALAGAIEGYQVYKHTGDKRLAARVGVWTGVTVYVVAMLWVVSFFAALSLLGSILGGNDNGDQGTFVFWSLFVLVASFVPGLYIYRANRRMVRRVYRPNVLPPDVPYGLPPTPPTTNVGPATTRPPVGNQGPPPVPYVKQGQQPQGQKGLQYTYDVTTGTFHKNW
jgi:hypothetical protein